MGALIRRDARMPFPPALIAGGGQERGARAGTENVLGIAGFGAAAKAALATLGAERAHLLALRERLEAGLKGHSPPGLVIFGAGVERLPNTILFTVPGLKAETAVIALDLAGRPCPQGPPAHQEGQRFPMCSPQWGCRRGIPRGGAHQFWVEHKRSGGRWAHQRLD